MYVAKDARLLSRIFPYACSFMRLFVMEHTVFLYEEIRKLKFNSCQKERPCDNDNLTLCKFGDIIWKNVHKEVQVYATHYFFHFSSIGTCRLY